MRRLVATVIITGALLSPALAQAISVEELRQQIATLLTQITRIQEQIKDLPVPASAGVNSSVGTVTANTACPLIVRSLVRGSRGDDVLMLQKFLVAQSMLSADSATGFYGALTESAVREWQAKNNIVSSGDAATSGYGAVGARTRAALRAACGGESTPVNDSISIASIGLDVSADATVNARGSCDAASYTLTFGDFSALQTISVPANTCHAIKQSFVHTYPASGTYTVQLSGKNTQINAPISVLSGAATNPSGCIAPSFASTAIPIGSVGVPWAFTITSSANEKSVPVVTATGTPPGVSVQSQIQVSTSTGAVVRTWAFVGMPTTAGTYSITLNLKNSCGTAERRITLPVNDKVTNQCTFTPVQQCSGTLQWSGLDSNGCSLGYQCIAAPVQPPLWRCPVHMIELCPTGEHMQMGPTTYDANQCPVTERKCVPDSLLHCPVYMLAQCPTGQHMKTGTTTYDTQGCPVTERTCVADSPSCNLFATPSNVQKGQNVVFSWATQNSAAGMIAIPSMLQNISVSGLTSKVVQMTVTGNIGADLHIASSDGQVGKCSTSVQVTDASVSSSCAADIAALQSRVIPSGEICGLGGGAMKCPSDASYVVRTLSTCETGFLKERGWTSALAACPQYMPPLCSADQHLVGGSYDSSTGCYGSPQCVANSPVSSSQKTNLANVLTALEAILRKIIGQ